MFATKLSLVPNPHNDQSTIAALVAGGDPELGNARITAADRRFVRRLEAVAEKVLSDEAFMLLAGAAEHAAWRRRAETQ
jgi:hypothetical protein